MKKIIGPLSLSSCLTIGDMKEKNVTDEYLKTAAPGEGTITYDKDYKIRNHRDEIATAKWLRDTFGGNIHIFNERGYTRVSPDYQWNGKW